MEKKKKTSSQIIQDIEIPTDLLDLQFEDFLV